MLKKFLYFIIAFLLFSSSQIISQDIEDYVSSYTGQNGKGYMQPFANVFGANLNSGLFHSADIPTVGFNIYIGVVTMTGYIPDEDKKFTATTEGFFSPTMTVEAPTIFGAASNTVAAGDNGTAYSFPGGLDINKLPIAVPQMTVGSFAGTDATLRFMQLNLGDNLGDLSVFGIGARHSISQYLPLVPLDLAAGIYYQSFDVGNIVKASAFLLSAQASYSLPVVTFYGGLGYESSSMDISYDYGDPTDPQNVSIEVDAVNSVRLTVGAALKLAVVVLNVDYNIASQNVLVLGLGFEF